MKKCKKILVIDENDDWEDMYSDLCHASFGDLLKITWSRTYDDALKKLIKGAQYDVILFNAFVLVENSFEMAKVVMQKAHAVNQNVIVLETMKAFVWLYAEQIGLRVYRTDRIWEGHDDHLIGCFDENLNLVEYIPK